MQITQTFSIAIDSIKSNKLRTILTILGVVVGIFSIIVIMTVITMLQSTIEDGVSFLSKNTFQINKFPAIHTGDQSEWQKYRNRKDITLDDFYRFEETMKSAKYVGAEQGTGGQVVKYTNRETNPNIYILGVTMGAYYTHNVTINDGRAFSEIDIQDANNVCILGNDVVTKVFPYGGAVGKYIRISNREYKVLGTFAPSPSFFGQSEDNFVIVPISTYQNQFGKTGRSVSITVMAPSAEEYNNIIEQAIGYMRNIRKVQPGEDNDFEIFSNETIMTQINSITGGVKIGAIAISIIALLAAGVGIMNIMLVSVTERTREIGIRKAIGAKKITILTQFLFEAIILCLIGGFIGIFLGVGLGNLAGSALNAKAAIPYDWVMIGLVLCVIVGIVFGTYPAYKASNMDPIEALRYE